MRYASLNRWVAPYKCQGLRLLSAWPWYIIHQSSPSAWSSRLQCVANILATTELLAGGASRAEYLKEDFCPPGGEWTPIVSVARLSCWPLGSHALPCFRLCFFRTMKQLLFWDFERCTWSKGPLSPVLQLLIRMNGWIDDRKTDGWMFYVELLGDILPSIISFF